MPAFHISFGLHKSVISHLFTDVFVVCVYRVYGTSNIGMSLLTRGQPVGGTSSTTSSTSSLATNSSGSSSNHQVLYSLFYYNLHVMFNSNFCSFLVRKIVYKKY